MPEFAVIRHFSPLNTSFVGIYAGTDADDACGVAALDKDTSGKYTAFDLADGTTRQVEITQTTTRTSVPFSDE